MDIMNSLKWNKIILDMKIIKWKIWVNVWMMKELSSMRVLIKYVDVCWGYFFFFILYFGIFFKVYILYILNIFLFVKGYFIIGIIIGNYIL